MVAVITFNGYNKMGVSTLGFVFIIYSTTWMTMIGLIPGAPYLLMNENGGVGPWIYSIYHFPYSFGKCNVGLRNKIFKGLKCLPGSHQEIVQYLSEFFM